jgi:8-oxo-dGTP pyrophosphatase MutT (NUDIX family)
MLALPPDFTERLQAHQAVEPTEVPARRAAVAAVLSLTQDSPEVLLMRRSQHPKDPWSGHISFPGGGHEAQDNDLFATALRETREELGLDLSVHGELLTRLAPVPAVGRGQVLPMDITAFVFRLVGMPELQLGDEAEEAFWLPLLPVVRGELDCTHAWKNGQVTRQLPAWEYEGHVIWGLTYRMLGELLSVARALPA